MYEDKNPTMYADRSTTHTRRLRSSNLMYGDMVSAILVNGAPDLGSSIKFRSSRRMFAIEDGLNLFKNWFEL